MLVVIVVAWYILFLNEEVCKDGCHYTGRRESFLHFLMLVDHVHLFHALSILKAGVGVWYCRCRLSQFTFNQHSNQDCFLIWSKKFKMHTCACGHKISYRF
jgi:hypothetical protein